jgi:hypothetical protein
VDPETLIGGFDTQAFNSAFWRRKTLDYFKYVEIQKGLTDQMVQGFVVRVGFEVRFWYRWSVNEDWDSVLIDDNSVNSIDVTFGGRFVYYLKSDDYGRTLFWDGAKWVVTTFGHLGEPPAFLTKGFNEGASYAFQTADVEEDKIVIALAYRLMDSRRNLWSPLRISYLTLDKPTADTFHLYATFSLSLEDLEHYDTIEAYRTMNYGSTFYRTHRHCVPEALGVRGLTLGDFLGDNPATLIPLRSSTNRLVTLLWGYGSIPPEIDYQLGSESWDDSIYWLPAYDHTYEEAGVRPQGSRIYYADGVNYLTSQGATTARGAGDVLVSHLVYRAPEVFPTNNIYSVPRVSDRIERFLRSGDAVYGLASARLFRFSRAGTMVAGERVSHGWGLLNRWSAAEIGTDLALVGPSTLVLITGATGAHTTVGAIERLLTRTWTDRSQVFAIYDAAMAALFVCNPLQGDAFILWATTNTVTRLKDFPFFMATAGPIPLVSGVDRAFFVNEYGVIAYPNLLTGPPWNMLGLVGDTSGSWIYSGFTEVEEEVVETFFILEDVELEDPTHYVGGYLYLTGTTPDDTTGRYRIIRAEQYLNTVRLFTDPEAPVGVWSHGWLLAPVVLEVVGWMLSAPQDPQFPVHDYVSRRKADSIGVIWGVVGIDPEQPAPACTVGLRKTPEGADEVSSQVLLSTDPDQSFGAARGAGQVLFPFVKCMVPNCDLELRAMTVTGEIEDSRRS